MDLSCAFFFSFFSGEVMVGVEQGGQGEVGQWMAEEKVGGGIFLKW